VKFAAAILSVLFSISAAAEQSFVSSVAQANLIELYTSEGCSSCPPADRWLSSLRDDPDLWSGIVPVGFHVDYWNYIGWKDRFSSSEYSERQRQYAREGGVGVVYTPGVLFNGREWRNFGWSMPQSGDGSDVGVLLATLKGSQLEARFDPVDELAARDLVLNMALLGAGLSTEVEAGENRGRRLAHDFTVLAYEQDRLKFDGTGYAGTAELPATEIDAERLGLALWVSTRNSQAPLQATGGWLEP
jgi:hypothetical protein